MPHDDFERYAKKSDLGHYRRVCQNPVCPNGYDFRTGNPRALYCCDECQRVVQNKRNYAKKAAEGANAYRRKKSPEEIALNAAGLWRRECRNPKCENGGEFITRNKRARYCCDECQKSAQNARNYARRRAR